MKATLQRWGNSQGIRIPKSMIEPMGLEIGCELTIKISEDQSCITLTPSRDSRPIRGRYRIKDLVASSSSEAFKGELDWGSPHGKEMW